MALAHAALTLLIDRERHAYEITTLLGHLIPGPPYNHRQVHGNMTQLEARGYVTSRWIIEERNRKRMYRITATGRQAWARWRAHRLPRLRPSRDEVLLRCIVVGLDDPRLLGAVLNDYGNGLRTDLERFETETVDPAACGSRSELLLALARLRSCLHLQAELRWVARCQEEIRVLVDMPREVGAPARDTPVLRFTPSNDDRNHVPGALRTSKNQMHPPSNRRALVEAPNGDASRTCRTSSGASPFEKTRG
jgi:DNA-binding PadR family transcriptional regulator